jgi:branched-subunit amino acid transport protein
VSEVWIVVAVVGAGTVAIKGLGPVVFGRRSLPGPLTAVLFLLAPALLAALVVTQAVGGDRELVFDERLIGLGAAAVAIALRAPLLAVVVIAAAVTALARAVS